MRPDNEPTNPRVLPTAFKATPVTVSQPVGDKDEERFLLLPSVQTAQKRDCDQSCRCSDCLHSLSNFCSESFSFLSSQFSSCICSGCGKLICTCSACFGFFALMIWLIQTAPVPLRKIGPANSTYPVCVTFNNTPDGECLFSSPSDLNIQRKLLTSGADTQLLSTSDFPRMFQDQFQDAFVQGTLVTFISTLTQESLKKLGCTDQQIVVIDSCAKFLIFCALNGGLPQESESLLNFAMIYGVSTILPATFNYIESKFASTLMNTIFAAGSIALSLYCKPPETLSKLAGGLLGFLGAKSALAFVDHYQNEKIEQTLDRSLVCSV